MDKLHFPETDRFFKAVLSLDSVEECYKFFGDACTIKEISEMSQRFEVAQLLDEGKLNYNEIRDLTGASTATITRINKCLHYGNDGYRIAIDRLAQG